MYKIDFKVHAVGIMTNLKSQTADRTTTQQHHALFTLGTTLMSILQAYSIEEFKA